MIQTVFAPAWPRFVAIGRDIGSFARHLIRFSWCYATLGISVWIVSQHYWFGINVSHSLPYHLVWIDRKAEVGKGDLIVYRFSGEEVAGHLRGAWFFKRIQGLTGDHIVRRQRNIFINGIYAGHALARTSRGESLDPIDEMIIPAGYLYVRGDHPESFDSRYRQSGLVKRSQVIGRAHVLF